MNRSLTSLALEEGGKIHPLIIPAKETNGTGLMNPSIYDDGGKLIVNLRHVNYTFYHSERKLFQHPWGPLTYVHPEHDLRLVTTNYLLQLNEDLSIQTYSKVDTSKLDKPPIWEFVGLEDARLVRWDGVLYQCGVRRDTTTNGVGRMELSKLQTRILPDDQLDVWETFRVRIEPPNDPNSYCEKNWMPVLDMPYHFVKWTNPTELVKVDPTTGKSQTVKLSQAINLPNDLRGGSQVIPWRKGYLALTHEVQLFNSEVGRKDAVYRHRLIYWDKDWNILQYSRDFDLMSGHVEFAVGLVNRGDKVYISFGFQDNAAFILETSPQLINKMLNNIL